MEGALYPIMGDRHDEAGLIFNTQICLFKTGYSVINISIFIVIEPSNTACDKKKPTKHKTKQKHKKHNKQTNKLTNKNQKIQFRHIKKYIKFKELLC